MMKLAILLFSPSGNTRDVAQRISVECRSRGIDCALVDLTGEAGCVVDGAWGDAIARRLPPHDVLLVGGPVYAHHLHYNVASMIEALPAPTAEWGKLAIPFVTYGGISSGVALREAGRLLARGGRTVVAGLKVAASHRMTRAFMDQEFNADLPAEPMLAAVATLVDRMAALTFARKPASALRSLAYADLATSIKARLVFRERVWHARRYPRVVIDADACSGCGRCASVCPVRHIAVGAEGRAMTGGSDCIHCLNCVSACSRGAVRLEGDLERGRRFMSAMISRQGNKETPATAVYPLRTARAPAGGGRVGNGVFRHILKAFEAPRRSGLTPREALERAGVGSATRVLEVGCGLGYYTAAIPALLGDGARCLSIDIHQEAVRSAKERLATVADGNRVQVETRNALQTGLADASFDLILLLGLLPSPFLPAEEIIPEMLRILKPGGVIAVWSMDGGWAKRHLPRSGLTLLDGVNGIHRFRKTGD